MRSGWKNREFDVSGTPRNLVEAGIDPIREVFQLDKSMFVVRHSWLERATATISLLQR